MTGKWPREMRDLVVSLKVSFQHCLTLLWKNLIKGYKNLISEFKKTGIYPLDKNQVLARLPKNVLSQIAIEETVGQSFIEKLEEKRLETTKKIRTRRTKLNIPPGKSVSSAEIINSKMKNGEGVNKDKENSPSKNQKNSTEIVQKPVSKKKRKIKKSIKKGDENDESTSTEILLGDSSGGEDFCDKDDFQFKDVDINSLEKGDFILVGLNTGKNRATTVYFVAEVKKPKENIHDYLEVLFLRKSLKKANNFINPNVPDTSVIQGSEIKMLMPTPLKNGKIRNNRASETILYFNINFDHFNIC